ncbi:SHOCT domain-containing protein [Mycobacterium sp. 4D054]|uniref:SHOCT domain-containing protein n=1 Tax=unclassified Mycobacterium TaxID=2642494 RepID=UPI0021B2CF92|nr:SHOCT domain-containing protein [Mycobacterium sp. SMC-8]UXA11605.1 SHOCT domain-containing protein [Mycobacterium sp. SMC-8]
MTGRVGPRVALTVTILATVCGAVGFLVTLMLNAFVYDEFDAYGQIPIPGTGQLTLPAGEVTVSFHTRAPGGTDGGFPVPPLRLAITSADGGPEPVVTETMSSTTSVNNDVRVRIWIARIPADGVYEIQTDGEVRGYIDPRMAFGRDTSAGWLPGTFGAVFVAGVVGLALAVVWSSRAGRTPRPLPGPVNLDEPSWPGPLPPPVSSYQPSDQRIRLEQLKTLAALRDSGVLTEQEFEAEKRRILEG